MRMHSGNVWMMMQTLLNKSSRIAGVRTEKQMVDVTEMHREMDASKKGWAAPKNGRYMYRK